MVAVWGSYCPTQRTWSHMMLSQLDLGMSRWTSSSSACTAHKPATRWKSLFSTAQCDFCTIYFLRIIDHETSDPWMPMHWQFSGIGMLKDYGVGQFSLTHTIGVLLLSHWGSRPTKTKGYGQFFTYISTYGRILVDVLSLIQRFLCLFMWEEWIKIKHLSTVSDSH